MLLVYSEKNSSRFRYIARLVLGQLLGLEVKFTNEREEYLQSNIAKLNYSKEPLQSGVFLQATNLLFDSDIFEQDISISEYENCPVFFSTSKTSSLPFDPLAASFFLVSRYEEYLPHIADQHGRFPAKESFMHKNGALHRPLVNEYAEMLADVLQRQNPNLKFRRPHYRFLNSVDVDVAYAYLGRGPLRVMGAFAKDLLNFDFKEIASRFKVLVGIEKDPFETFEQQLKWQEKYGYDSIYFALFARLAKYDRGLAFYSNRLHKYLKSINDFCKVGIHPSYAASGKPKLMEEELVRLENILNIDVNHSRQHYLKLSLPETYRTLMDLDITDDYTMGFAAEPGFRAGICHPFRFYDLEVEAETPLTVHPFPFMDGTYIYYKKLPPEKAFIEIINYIKVYKQFGGEFIPVWHNRVYSEKMPEWKGWNHVFLEMVKAAV